ncbi:MAG: acetyl-CoA carboxylase carboxyltransferase subunit alpha [Lachnospiraceae bacterium]|nr:acetyl-CoA carboxylase carboxyltransferase subunit alpha [Lachnospiraceae bacterium]
MIEELDRKIDEMEATLAGMQSAQPEEKILRFQLKRDRDELLAACRELTPADKVYLARHIRRPRIDDYTKALFTEFFEQKGDRLGKEDPSIFGGIALFEGTPVTIIGHRKGHDLNENIKLQFGMPGPEGYRKALRLMKQAEKFHRPVILFIDTPGAYPGLEAEEFGQSQAIAENLAAMSMLQVPVLAIITGEGNSGGALAIGVANRVCMLENAVYSILSPEGFASILWHDASKSKEACNIMKLTAQDLKPLGVIDEILPEPPGGAHRNPQAVYETIRGCVREFLKSTKNKSGKEMARARAKKIRRMDAAWIRIDKAAGEDK